MQERHSGGWACYTTLHSLIKVTLRETLSVELYYLANIMSLSSLVYYRSLITSNITSNMSTTLQLPVTSVGWVVDSGELSQTQLLLALLQNTESHSAKCVIAYLASNIH